MTTDNIQPNNTEKNKEAVIFLDNYSSAELYEIKEMCNANDLKLSCVIYNYTLNDVRPYKEIIKYISDQDRPPVVLIDNNTCLFPQCIMSTTVLGALEEMKLAEIHVFGKDPTTNQLILDNQSIFNLLTEATFQLKLVEEICKEKATRDRKEDK